MLEEEQQQADKAPERVPLSVTLPDSSINPTPDEPTPLSSLGGGLSHAHTPVSAAAEAKENTALFYNGLFRASLNRHGMQGQPCIVCTRCNITVKVERLWSSMTGGSPMLLHASSRVMNTSPASMCNQAVDDAEHAVCHAELDMMCLLDLILLVNV